MRRKPSLRLLLVLLLPMLLSALALAQDKAKPKPVPPPQVLLLKAEGVVNPAMSDLIEGALKRAGAERAAALVIELDTPGGLDTSMRQIVKGIMNSPIPVVVWVAPQGARAASAGVMITLAGDVAAMAPGTNIGAASPVSMTGEDLPKTMAKKVVNDMVAFARSICTKRGRNGDWAEKAVRESVSVPADEAVRLRVVDFIATDEATLLTKLDGFRMAGRQGQVLRLNGARLVLIEEGLRSKVLRTLSDPNLAYLLFMIGLAGLYFEFSTPGAILPGVVGAICLILAFFALQTIPVSYAGVALIVLAVILFIAEIKIISHGVLALGGAVALILGSLMLFDTPELYMRVSLAVILPAAVAFSLFFALVVRLAVRAHRAKPLTGERGIVGETGRVTEAVGPQGGKVFVHGEYWNAVSEAPIEAGVKVRVVAVEELTLKVERV